MRRFILSLFLLSCAFTFSAAQTSAVGLRTENLPEPLGLSTRHPWFSWQLQSARPNVRQTAYEIRVLQGERTIWNSGKVSSENCRSVPYQGPALSVGHRYAWQVRVWDNQASEADWSTPARFGIGPATPADWKATWIEPMPDSSMSPRPSPILRREFNSRQEVAEAMLYVTAHGMYELHLNGERVGKDHFTPGWTSYNKRLAYQSYDVTGQIRRGENVLAATIGSGWYRGNLAWGGTRDIYGKQLGLLCQLLIRYRNGSEMVVTSDDQWKCTTGGILDSEIYHGETYDARLEPAGWRLPGFDDTAWQTVRIADHPLELLTATENEMIRIKEAFDPVQVIRTPKGETVLDFGQNLVGWVTVKASGKSGDRIVLSHSEVLDKAGNFYTESLRAARQQNTFVLRGGGNPETFRPHFTWQGFRYVRVDEYPGSLDDLQFRAYALYSDMEPTGTFTCSNPLLNQLQHNIQWGQRGNFLDVPTDCPQRDERLGWTGDAQAFARTAAFNFDVQNFFSKWLKDLAADQQPSGSVPFVIPNVLGDNAGGSAGWADAATIIPWTMYQVYGDLQVLDRQYESMKAWVGFMEQNSTAFLWNKGFHFGDWLFYRPEDDNDGRSAVTDKYLIAQCFFAHSTRILAESARLLGKEADRVRYERLLANVRQAFQREYMTATGRLVSGTQTAYVLALQFDMLPDAVRQQAVDRLVDNIRSYGNHLTTGFLGTPYLCHVLTRFGRTDVAYELLLQEDYPSWLYPVRMGATTIWERWDGIKPDSSFQTPGMNSFNHYAYGAIGDWMYRHIAGIDLLPGEGVGYRHALVKPLVGGGLTHAAATLRTPYGNLSTEWRISTERTFTLAVAIPPNTRATVSIPTRGDGRVLEDGNPVKGMLTEKADELGNRYLILELGSGEHTFTAPWE
ncbi:MAG: hypothetical protein RLY31_557 [Bacteroidota bacterium]|jgi:alpha-L-rhamnosidase